MMILKTYYVLMNRRVCLTISILTKLHIIVRPIRESLKIKASYPINRV